MDSGLQKYAALLAVVTHGSFTKAAEKLNYTQSAISRMIRDLEEDWNLTLLERNHTGATLTPDGMLILQHARNLFQAYENLQQRVNEIHGLQCGLIRIGTFSSVATHWLPPIIREFKRAYPDIEYELLLGDYAEIEQWIAEGRVDCGFVRIPTLQKFETQLLEKERLLVVLPEHHKLVSASRVPIRALEDNTFILLERGINVEIKELFQQNGMDVHAHFTTWDDYAIMSMIECGLGISILPELILRRVSFKVVAKELDVPAFRSIGLAVRSMRDRPLVVRKFMEYLPYRNAL
nr:LysR family transcriptional regulator [uncultured Sphaerochaeta sp.]